MKKLAQNSNNFVLVLNTIGQDMYTEGKLGSRTKIS